MPKCDFCSSPNPTYAYPCENYRQDIPTVFGNIDWGSIGHWAACDTCSEIIETGDAMALAEHSFNSIPVEIPPHHTPIIRHRLEGLHLEFMVRRSQRIPIEEYEGD